MQAAKEIVVLVLLIGGYFFLAAGVIGLLRLPDLYNRIHAMGKCDTLGICLPLLAMLILIPGASNKIKLLMIFGIVMTVNPVMTHLIMKTAYDRGTPMVQGSSVTNLYDHKKGSSRRKKVSDK